MNFHSYSYCYSYSSKRQSMVSMLLLMTMLGLFFLCTTIVKADDSTIIDDTDTDRLRPDDYVDDIYHCDDPERQYDFMDDPSDTLSCDPSTWKWNVDELSSQNPPTICDGIEELQPDDFTWGMNIEDWFEPCLLWSMAYGNLQQVDTMNTLVPSIMVTVNSTDTVSIPDDLFHCRDPMETNNNNDDDDNTINCDEMTYLWNTDDLNPDRPPDICGRNFQISPEEVTNVQDWFEPCVLWAMAYGDLMPTVSPTLEPTQTTVSPTFYPTTESPTSFPTTSPTTYSTTTPVTVGTTSRPSLAEPPAGEPGTGTTTNTNSDLIVLDPIVLTLFWPSSVMDQASFSLDRSELRTLTERHVLEGLQAELGLTLVQSVHLVFNSGVPTRSTLTETITGTVSLRLNAGIPSTTVQRLVQQSFQGNALELYQFRLQIANDVTLQQVDSVTVGTDVDSDTIAGGGGGGGGGRPPNPNTNNNNNNGGGGGGGNDEDDGLGIVLIAVVASVSAAFLAVACFAICMCYCSSQRAKKMAARSVRSNSNSNSRSNYYKSGGGSMSSSSKMSRSRWSNRSNPKADAGATTDMIPPIPTQSSSGEDHNMFPPIYEEDEENQASLITMSELDDQSQGGAGFTGPIASDDQSVGTSVYSYFNDDNSMLGGGGDAANSIANNSFLYSIHGKDINNHADDNNDDNDDDTLAELFGQRHGTNEASSKSKKKGLMWSVMDTLATHFGGDDDNHDYEVQSTGSKASRGSGSGSSSSRSSRSNKSRNKGPTTSILGPEPTTDSDENGSGNSGNLLYANDKSAKSSGKDKLLPIQTKSSKDKQDNDDDDVVVDFEAADKTSPQATTPVKERLERMWRQDDEEDKQLENSIVPSKSSSCPPDSSQGTFKDGNLSKNKGQGVRVFQDDGSGNGSNSVNSSYGTDGSPAASVLLETASAKSASRIESVPPDDSSQAKTVPQIVNRIPNSYKRIHDNQGNDDDEDDDKMALRLPAQLKTIDPNSDNMSQGSSISSRSGRSALSVGSGRSNLSGNSRSSLLEAGKQAQSVRSKKKNDNAWGSSGNITRTSNNNKNNNSGHSRTSPSAASIVTSASTDSAKYRTLLNQGDTNDAALFGLKDGNGDDSASVGSALAATRLKYDNMESAKKKEGNKSGVTAPLTNLIKSFDQVWSKEAKDSKASSLPSKKTKSSSPLDAVDSDEEDIYVEEDEGDDNNEKKSNTNRNGGSTSVRQLGSLLTSPSKNKNKNSTSRANSEEDQGNDDANERLPFEIVDTSDDESSDEEKKDDGLTPEQRQYAEAVNMERLRRLSVAGYAETMASF